jgi:hypothetical protein
MLPKEFEEVSVRVYARHKSQAAELKRAFNQWCSGYSMLAQTLTSMKRQREPASHAAATAELYPQSSLSDEIESTL